ncbi:hypothetical protein [Vreelandella aquamarina]|nr:hypothetical protein [Halomonas aquamarina]
MKTPDHRLSVVPSLQRERPQGKESFLLTRLLERLGLVEDYRPAH